MLRDTERREGEKRCEKLTLLKTNFLVFLGIIGMYSKKQKVEVYAIFILVVLVIELFMAIVLQKGLAAYYTSVHRPDWALPRYLIVPIWVGLYILYAISGGKIWLKRKSLLRQHALAAWVVVLVLNIVWPVTFFYVPIPIVTPVILSIIFISLLVLLFYSFLVSRAAGFLLIPLSFMILYLFLFHWTFFILDIQLI